MRLRPKGSAASDRGERPAETGDADAIKRVAAGELSAMADIYDRHHGAVFDFVVRLTRDDSDVEDIVHATFLTAARRATTFDGRAPCRPWLLGIAAQLVRRRRRSLARLARALFDFASHLRLAAALDPSDMLVARDELRRMETAFAKLSHAKRAVLLLAEVEGMTCEGIATTLKIPIGTVWTRLHHARRELADTLEAKEAP
jgi:RNA polymerase sigma-70 factor (ECF subfamily)